MACVPPARVEVVNLAWLLDTSTGSPSCVLPSKKVTVPVRLGAPEAGVPMVRVKVTDVTGGGQSAGTIAGADGAALVVDAADGALAQEGGARLDGHDAAAQFAVRLQSSRPDVEGAAEGAAAVAGEDQRAASDLDEAAR